MPEHPKPRALARGVVHSPVYLSDREIINKQSITSLNSNGDIFLNLPTYLFFLIISALYVQWRKVGNLVESLMGWNYMEDE